MSIFDAGSKESCEYCADKDAVIEKLSGPRCPHWVANDYVHDRETAWRCDWLDGTGTRPRVPSYSEDFKYLLGVIDNLRQFKLPVLQGLDATFYATLSYEGDLEIATRIEEIRKRTEER